MATRAEMEAELKMLRAKMAESEIDRENAPPPTPPDETEETNDPPVSSAAAGSPADDERAEVRTELDRLLTPLGVSQEELDELARQFWKELDTLPQNKPLLTAIGAFGLGFLVGRMTR
ncbi:MAG: hypothetical protein AAF678_00310 [Pseudomonadota bacterium]